MPTRAAEAARGACTFERSMLTRDKVSNRVKCHRQSGTALVDLFDACYGAGGQHNTSNRVVCVACIKPLRKQGTGRCKARIWNARQLSDCCLKSIAPMT